MTIYTPLDVVMKMYEHKECHMLTRKRPVIIRLDGKAFHTFTRGLDKPWDDRLMKSMQQTMLYLCAEVQGCRFGYTQSDEISLLLVDYERETSEAWFDYGIQKMVSVAASMATYEFNRRLRDWPKYGVNFASKVALFDARVFALPFDKVSTYFIWRQKDAIKNSVSMLAQSMFSHKQLDRVNTENKKRMILEASGKSWESYSDHQKYGACCLLEEQKFTTPEGVPFLRNKFVVPECTPVFEDDEVCIANEVFRGYLFGKEKSYGASID